MYSVHYHYIHSTVISVYTTTINTVLYKMRTVYTTIKHTEQYYKVCTLLQYKLHSTNCVQCTLPLYTLYSNKSVHYYNTHCTAQNVYSVQYHNTYSTVYKVCKLLQYTLAVLYAYSVHNHKKAVPYKYCTLQTIAFWSKYNLRHFVEINITRVVNHFGHLKPTYLMGDHWP